MMISKRIRFHLQQKQKRRMVKYGKLVMIHEENAPLPPALPSQVVSCQQL